MTAEFLDTMEDVKFLGELDGAEWFNNSMVNN